MKRTITARAGKIVSIRAINRLHATQTLLYSLMELTQDDDWEAAREREMAENGPTDEQMEAILSGGGFWKDREKNLGE